jgi:hypothetical protein
VPTVTVTDAVASVVDDPLTSFFSSTVLFDRRAR